MQKSVKKTLYAMQHELLEIKYNINKWRHALQENDQQPDHLELEDSFKNLKKFKEQLYEKHTMQLVLQCGNALHETESYKGLTRKEWLIRTQNMYDHYDHLNNFITDFFHDYSFDLERYGNTWKIELDEAFLNYYCSTTVDEIDTLLYETRKAKTELEKLHYPFFIQNFTERLGILRRDDLIKIDEHTLAMEKYLDEIEEIATMIEIAQKEEWPEIIPRPPSRD